MMGFVEEVVAAMSYRKIYDNLSIEVTRRCNMACAHCMRGDAQNSNISDEILERALSDVSSIGELCLTGGEPSIAVDRIWKVIKLLKKYHIEVYGFYVVTNGKQVTTDFLHAMIELYAYVQQFDKEGYTTLALSSDKYHEPIPVENHALLSALSFFSSEDKKTDWDIYQLLDLGRAKALDAKKREANWNPFLVVDRWNDTLRVEEGQITLTVNGNFLGTCDYEYAEEADLKLGDVWHPEDFEASLLKIAEECA